jgi:hypothetical protein
MGYGKICDKEGGVGTGRWRRKRWVGRLQPTVGVVDEVFTKGQ